MTALNANAHLLQIFARGWAELLSDAAALAHYSRMVHEACREGPSMAETVARFAVPILKQRQPVLTRQFLNTLLTLHHQGHYSWNGTLRSLTPLLAAGDVAAAQGYLALLDATFSRPLSYVRCHNLMHRLPRAVAALAGAGRQDQIPAMVMAAQCDVHLLAALLDGLQQGLRHLPYQALQRFVHHALELRGQSLAAARHYLALESQSGREAFARLDTRVKLAAVKPALDRYLPARTGMALTVRPVSELPEGVRPSDTCQDWMASDGRSIYLPEVMHCLATREQNRQLYRLLAGIEAGQHEFGTYDFDLDKLRDSNGGRRFMAPSTVAAEGARIICSDLENFFKAFDNPALAEDLFTIFEHGRVRLHLQMHYPGLMEKALPILRRQAERSRKQGFLQRLYQMVALNAPPTVKDAQDRELQALVRRFRKVNQAASPVEVSGALVLGTYEQVRRLHAWRNDNHGLLRLLPPFGRRLQPALWQATHLQEDRLARWIQGQLAQKGLKVYRSDVKRRLRAGAGASSQQDLQPFLALAQRQAPEPQARASFSPPAADMLTPLNLPCAPAVDDAGAAVFWYDEWAENLKDYLPEHTRLLEREAEGAGEGFYRATVARHRSLIKQVRRSFARLRPEGLTRLRPWLEGDEFDYRAMIDYAVNRRLGRFPSERLYIKRIKQQRDVAVLLLVDMSRSTANTVPGGQASVLEVAKQALVLFSEALEAIGDHWAVAGFSGSGRLGVEYFRIKDFTEKMHTGVRQRIGGLRPQRNTRMGAAIRHAAKHLEQVVARLRLLMIIGDGFPNDLGYKQAYAIADTRRAIREAHAKHIHTHAITVNLAADPQLDDLFGRGHHHLISNLQQLPGKLLRTYGLLTRS